MNKFCRVLALILAVLMLVTMATACKKSDDDDWESIDKNQDAFDYPEDDPEDEGSESEGGKENSSGNVTEKEEGKGNSKDPEKENSKDPEKEDEKEDEKEEAPPIDKVVEEYDATKKYDVASNPLLAESKPLNTGTAVSFDIDTTGFVKNNIKLADLKGKTLTLITSVKYGVFNYDGPNGEYLSEWDWFKSLKTEYGLNIKYIESRFTEAISQILTYMNAGKALDVIPTHMGGFPLYLNLSQPLDPYINLQNIDNSPGVDTMTLKATRYGGGYRCIAPIGTVDVIWYDQSRTEELGLTDPHKLWQQDKWDWDAWRDYISSAPQTTNSGMKIAAWANINYHVFAATDGIQIIELDTESDKMKIKNNWMDERVLRAITYYESAVKAVQNGNDLGVGGGGVLMVGDVLMGETVVLMNDYDTKDEYAKNHKVNWVPYPKSPYDTGRYVALNFGYTCMLPKKMKSASNAPYAVKYMELWATRFTEAMFDYLATTKFLQFNYQQRKEYFEFCIENTYFPISMNEWRNLGNDVDEAMRAANTGYIYAFSNRNMNVATEHAKVANIVAKAIDYAVAFAE